VKAFRNQENFLNVNYENFYNFIEFFE
jgi:hypothetical protein